MGKQNAAQYEELGMTALHVSRITVWRFYVTSNFNSTPFLLNAPGQIIQPLSLFRSMEIVIPTSQYCLGLNNINQGLNRIPSAGVSSNHSS